MPARLIHQNGRDGAAVVMADPQGLRAAVKHVERKILRHRQHGEAAQDAGKSDEKAIDPVKRRAERVAGVGVPVFFKAHVPQVCGGVESHVVLGELHQLCPARGAGGGEQQHGRGWVCRADRRECPGKGRDVLDAEDGGRYRAGLRGGVAPREQRLAREDHPDGRQAEQRCELVCLQPRAQREGCAARLQNGEQRGEKAAAVGQEQRGGAAVSGRQSGLQRRRLPRERRVGDG